MTAVKEQFRQMIPDIEQNLPLMQDSDVQQFVNLWIEVKPTTSKPERKLAADGILHHLADPSKIPDEEGAWAKAAVEKYKRKMVEMNEAD